MHPIQQESPTAVIPSQESKAARLRDILLAPKMTLLMEAHNGLSARIAEDCGFAAIWASGLSIASTLGLRDHNEASWTQVVAILETMVDATKLPILFDGDTGFGNFNNFRLVVKKLCNYSVSGVVVEDKLFPKLNSFVGDNHALAFTEEFCGKIKAGRDTQTDPNFCIIARTEALIAGRTMSEALDRAEAYRRAGADAIFIHSRKKTAEEILAFAREWARRTPLVIAPTTYYQADAEELERAGVSVYICANHSLRAAVKAMQATGRKILADRGIRDIESGIGSLNELFRLLDYAELAEAEARYLPRGSMESGS